MTELHDIFCSIVIPRAFPSELASCLITSGKLGQALPSQFYGT